MNAENMNDSQVTTAVEMAEVGTTVDPTIDPSIQEAADALYNTNTDNTNNTEEHSQELETPDLSTDTNTESESSEGKSTGDESSTDDEPGLDEKAEDREKGENIKYELKLNEDSKLDKSFLGEMEDFAKEHGLSNDAAQELVDWQNDMLNNVVIRAQEIQEKQIDTWRQEVVEDPELGGENLAQVSEYAKNVVKRYGNEKLIGMLNESGLGNHIEVVRFLSSIGRAMSNDSFESGQTKPREKEAWELFYGSDYNN